MTNKSCKKCGEKRIKKDGFKRGKQRYRCCFCGYVFQNSSRDKKKPMIWKDFGEGKQSYKQLSLKYKLSVPTIQKHLDKILVKKKS